MFSEEDFSTDNEGSLVLSRTKTSRVGSDAHQLEQPSTYVYHQLADPNFSHFLIVDTTEVLQYFLPLGKAAVSEQLSPKYAMSYAQDPRLACGDLYIGHICHCISCVLARGVSLLPEKGPICGIHPTILFLDMDNYGYSEFNTAVDLSRDWFNSLHALIVSGGLFVWAYYGACFERRYSTDPAQDFSLSNLPNRDSKVKLPSRNSKVRYGSIWYHLIKHRAVLCIPCGGHSQAVDQCMLYLAYHLIKEGIAIPRIKSSTPQCKDKPRLVCITKDKMLASTFELIIQSFTNSSVHGVSSFINPAQYKSNIDLIIKEIVKISL